MPARRNKPLLIGLTGSIGMGKTASAKMFAQLGVPVYDADAAVHELYEEGGPVVAAIAKTFPGAVRNGRVDRAILAELVSGDTQGFERLEAIVHPLVRRRRTSFLEKLRREGTEMAVLDIPLLFETGGQSEVDIVVVASAPEAVQEQRVLARPGMTLKRLEGIRARQIPDSEKRAKADFVIDTGGSLEHAFEQVKTIVATLRDRYGPGTEHAGNRP